MLNIMSPEQLKIAYGKLFLFSCNNEITLKTKMLLLSYSLSLLVLIFFFRFSFSVTAFQSLTLYPLNILPQKRKKKANEQQKNKCKYTTDGVRMLSVVILMHRFTEIFTLIHSNFWQIWRKKQQRSTWLLFSMETDLNSINNQSYWIYINIHIT